MIYRVVHNKNYTVINNTICRDKRLSWKAKGIWLYAFSRPDDWKFHIDDLVNQSSDGEKSVKAGLRELEDFGYLVREQSKDENGKFSNSEWTFFEVPQEIKEILPQACFGPAEIGPAQKAPLLSTEEKPSTERKQQQQRGIAAVFFDCLRDVDIPESDKVWLSKHHSEAVVKRSVDWATHPKTKINESLQQAIKWGCNNNPEIPKFEADLSEENKAYAENVEANTIRTQNSWVECGPKYVSVITSGNSDNSTFINYTEKGFKEQLENAMRKRGLKQRVNKKE